VSKSFLDLVLAGKVERDWIDAYGQVFAGVMKADYGDALDAASPPSQSSPALPVAAYLGTYANDFYGELEVAEENDGLVVKLGPPQGVLSASALRSRHIHIPAGRRECFRTECRHLHCRG
jgi:hypothetical protein